MRHDQLAFAHHEHPSTLGAESPARLHQLAQERDRAIDALSARREAVIAKALEVAKLVCFQSGTITGPRLVEAMRVHGYGNLLDGIDPRWTGGVLLPSRGFVDTGARVASGSKGRKVTVWRWGR